MIQKRDDLISIPQFSKMFDTDVKAVRRMIAKSGLNCLELGDGRLYVDLDWMLQQCRNEGLKPSAWVRQCGKRCTSYHKDRVSIFRPGD